MDFKSTQEIRYGIARKRVEELKGFYVHLAVYIAVNIFLSARWVYIDVEDGFTFMESVTDINTYFVWLFWGIGVVFQVFKVFGSRMLLGMHWENAKIKEYMEIDKKR